MSRKGWIKSKRILKEEGSQVVSQDVISGGARTVAGCGDWKLDKWSARARCWVGPPSGNDGSETGETLEISVDRIIEYAWRREPKEDRSTN